MARGDCGVRGGGVGGSREIVVGGAKMGTAEMVMATIPCVGDAQRGVVAKHGAWGIDGRGDVAHCVGGGRNDGT